MFRKVLQILLLTAFILLGTFAIVLADQDGRTCWCNSDQYGCWVTADDGGKSYIMFWSEYARQQIMGMYSAPYEKVVTYPGFSATFPLECGIVISTPKPAAQPSPAADPEDDPEKPDPPKECDQYYESCLDECKRKDDHCPDPGITNCIGCAEQCYKDHCSGESTK